MTWRHITLITAALAALIGTAALLEMPHPGSPVAMGIVPTAGGNCD